MSDRVQQTLVVLHATRRLSVVNDDRVTTITRFQTRALVSVSIMIKERVLGDIHVPGTRTIIAGEKQNALSDVVSQYCLPTHEYYSSHVPISLSPLLCHVASRPRSSLTVHGTAGWSSPQGARKHNNWFWSFQDDEVHWKLWGVQSRTGKMVVFTGHRGVQDDVKIVLLWCYVEDTVECTCLKRLCGAHKTKNKTKPSRLTV